MRLVLHALPFLALSYGFFAVGCLIWREHRARKRRRKR